MHSIIEEIAGVEAMAQKLKQDALLEEREKVAQAQAGIEKQRMSAQEKARAALKTATQQAEKDGEILSANIIETRLGETTASCKAAEAKLPEAKEYLLRRVEEKA